SWRSPSRPTSGSAASTRRICGPYRTSAPVGERTMHITALPIVVPMIGAALLVACRHWTPRLVNDMAAGGVAITVATLSAILLARAVDHPFAYWMGGWRPSHMVAIGISLSIDPIGAGMAAFAALLVTAALVYS